MYIYIYIRVYMCIYKYAHIDNDCTAVHSCVLPSTFEWKSPMHTRTHPHTHIHAHTQT